MKEPTVLDAANIDAQSIGIDPRAAIHPTAVIAEDVTIGPWTMIGPHVEVGKGTKIYSHVVVDRNTKIGCYNTIYPYVSIGCDPQDLSYRGEDTWLEIGDHNIFREFVTINRGSTGGHGTTSINHKNSFLAYSHVEHDCKIGSEVLMVNNATIAGHVTIDDYVILGAFTAVHQFCRVGTYSFLSRATEISKDVPPYMLVKGLPGFPCGLNSVGLRRRGFSNSTMRGLKQAYQILYRRNLKFDDVLKELEALTKTCPEVQLILDLISESERGIARRTIEE